MAQQKTEFENKKQDDMMAQYQREQDTLSNRLVLEADLICCNA